MNADETKIAKRLGASLVAARKARGWSQDATAERADLSKKHLGYLERGDRLPSVGVLARLSKLLGLSLDELLLGERKGEREAADTIAALSEGVEPELRPLIEELMLAASRFRLPRPGRRR